MSPKDSILIVDDDESTRRSLELIFQTKGFETETAATGREARGKARSRSFNLAILDIKLPDIEGVDLVASLKEAHPDMVVVMSTAFATLDNAMRALNNGASAYLTKPLDIDKMLEVIRGLLEKQQRAAESRKTYEAAKLELARRREMEKQLTYNATHDPLTGLPNRQLFNERLDLELAHARRSRRRLALMMLDLDNFKEINDTLGHRMGDKLLHAVGERLSGALRNSDTVARIGGDEYMLILPEIGGPDDVEGVARKVLESLRRPLMLDGRELRITTSIGISVYPEHGENAHALIGEADAAMYGVKRRGRDGYQCGAVRP